MTVTVTGEDIDEVRRKAGIRQQTPAIAITWRRNDHDYGRQTTPCCGAIIKVDTEEVPKEFVTAQEASDYVRKYLERHDLMVEGDRLARMEGSTVSLIAHRTCGFAIGYMTQSRRIWIDDVGNVSAGDNCLCPRCHDTFRVGTDHLEGFIPEDLRI